MGDERRTADVNRVIANFDGSPLVGGDGRPLAITVGQVLANIIGGMRPRDGEEILRIQEFGLRIVKGIKGEAPLELDDADRGLLKEAIRQDIHRGQVAEREGRLAGSSGLMLGPLMELTKDVKDSKES